MPQFYHGTDGWGAVALVSVPSRQPTAWRDGVGILRGGLRMGPTEALASILLRATR